ncbi:protein-L-isoaspartate(D-aspartate) O-methyltransferase [Sporosarcina pasteurii]|uniref:Protein-L-isoaspartate O-methyltransferase n=1 Tax=Sporosarcina pasteurii TaxID=1474 RepID=A0A380BZI7_SPOPA|nr:protein-L-isoaspartate(D-aspartate) O-methyltransferase [Sporosarcina pasteurii]MDS9471391.1 protein-L-isoaspartate(D-aspartate) O-methyltransferase [Sporosarcina pasteurii]QBQ04981.1 protein-L-isoaspartate(D-aspartate) O-methyltransferase [Sporosarcina pasteurii]SUJ08774.1 Protein-L-isoaspartate O-methyltransferase [Sporosarcina pasteurii]
MTNQNEKMITYFKKLDRSFFMDSLKEFAHMDEAVPIGHEQTISQPSLVLNMTLSLDLQPHSKVLELGTGSGYQTALLAAFSESVYTIERIKPLYEQAKERLKEIGFSNIHFKFDDGSMGWIEHAPYDRIMVTAATSEIPRELLEQLALSGKMIIPVGTPVLQKLLLIEKDEYGKIYQEVLDHVRFVPLKGKYE